MKSHKIVDKSAASEAREKVSTDLDSLEILNFFEMSMTKYENVQIVT